MRLSSVDDLRAIYRPPGRGPVDKVIETARNRDLETTLWVPGGTSPDRAG